MSKKNQGSAAIIIWGMLTFSLTALSQPIIKREADYLKALQAIQAQTASDENRGAATTRRQSSVRRATTRTAERVEAAASEPVYYAQTDRVAGRTISDYSGDFLHFLFARPFDPGIVAFEKESKGMEFQHGPVWFLTPTLDGAPEREVVMPKNTAVFFSLGWAFGFLDDAEPDENMLGLQGFLSTVPEYFTDFDVALDYERLPREAIIATQSPTTYFPLLAETAQMLGIETMPRVYSRAALGGNFVLLKPLSAGAHVLKVRFSDVDGNTYVREYYLCVL